ncbi:MAG: hypothetical protein LBP33_04605 [Candidatus Adiutrix sp.]|jgi:hypothetical protein|nr:hypothetical protein [Candidatus Adiutrix sp.]
MTSYLTIDGHELTLGGLNERLSRTCLALHGLRSLISGTLKSMELGERECGRLTLAQMALETITGEAESLLPEWPDFKARGWVDQSGGGLNTSKQSDPAPEERPVRKAGRPG